MDKSNTAHDTLAYLTIREARNLLDTGRVWARELTEAAIDRIYALDDDIQAYEYVSMDVAREAARDFDRRKAPGHPPPGPGECRTSPGPSGDAR